MPFKQLLSKVVWTHAVLRRKQIYTVCYTQYRTPQIINVVFSIGGFKVSDAIGSGAFSYPEPFLRAARRGALAKSKTGNHKNMVKDIYLIRTITFVVANQMPV
jgi:hypothetical protein